MKKKMNIAEAAAHFDVSREAIHNRIRRGSLECVIEDGVKFVVVTNALQKPKKQSKKISHQVNDERYYKLLQEQNEKLQARVESLESETRTLRDQREEMLIEERKKIESIYKEKDEQLKSVLATLASQFQLVAPKQEEEVATYDAEIEDVVKEKETIISLKKYLKKTKVSKEKAKKIKAKFQKKAKKDQRIIEIDGKFYLDLVKYDYKGLI
jgi:DNA repair exonuclease SbcCD ATPase subunit